MKENMAALALVLFAQDPNPDANALQRELAQIASGEGTTATAFWCPAEFFRDSLQQRAGYSPEELEKILDALRAVNLFAVICGKLEKGEVRYEAPSSLPSRSKLRLPSGAEIPSLAEEQVAPEIRGFAAALRPTVAAALGPAGKNMALVFFPGKDRDGKRLLDPLARGEVRLVLRDLPAANREISLRWRLPLDSLLPSRECPRCRERCKGSWTYCPWDSAKL